MNRTYTAKRLLEHGPLTKAEFVEITGWEERQARRVLQQLLDTQVVNFQIHWAQSRKRFCHSKTKTYALASWIPAKDSQPLTEQKQSERSTGTTSFCRGWN